MVEITTAYKLLLGLGFQEAIYVLTEMSGTCLGVQWIGLSLPLSWLRKKLNPSIVWYHLVLKVALIQVLLGPRRREQLRANLTIISHNRSLSGLRRF